MTTRTPEPIKFELTDTRLGDAYDTDWARHPIARWTRQAAMATVTVELTEDRPVVRPGGQSWGFLEAITTGIRGAAQVFNFLISLLIASTPLVLAGIGVYFLVRSIRRRRARRRGRSPPR